MKETKDKDEKKNKSSKNKKKTGIGIALWCLAAVIILIIFIVEQPKIASNLKETDFFSRIGSKNPEFVEKAEIIPESKKDKNDVAPVTINVTKEAEETPKKAYESPVESKKTEADKSVKNEKPAEKKAEEKKPSEAADKTEEKKNASEAAKKITEDKKNTSESTMNLKLYFIEIDGEGSVNRKEFTRAMKKSDSPLVDSINALIDGPNAGEAKKGARSFIPEGTKLTGASVKKGVAVLNFNEDFEFNQYGVEGTLAQLQQIVFTATAFPTVDSVQILIGGEKKEYLGSEGVWIGTPLSRNSF